MNTPIIGILGDGQLAKYLIDSAKSLKLKTYALGLNPGECIAASDHVIGDIFNEKDVLSFAKKVDILTLENEFIPLGILEKVKEKMLPSFQSFKLIENKYAEKKLAKKLGIPQVDYQLIELSKLSYNGAKFYKLPKGGYDGKGNFLVQDQKDFDNMYAWLLASPYNEIIEEEILKFEKEVSITLVRDQKGNTISYPIVDTIQKNHTCEFVSIPSLVSSKIKNQITHYSTKLLDEINYTGVMSIEYFIYQGEIYYNECSPRPHNSAHYTMDACFTSQFENHIRSLAQMELALGDLKYPCALMFNLLGVQKGFNRLDAIKANEEEMDNSIRTIVHDYGKKEERPGRKMGHINMLGEDMDQLSHLARSYKAKLEQLGFTQ